eukprot:Colp12_sorted_trinity150504_noHs@35689
MATKNVQTRTLYKEFWRIASKWRVVEERKGRDLGEFLQQQIRSKFRDSKQKPLSDADINLSALKAILNNDIKNMHPRIRETAASRNPYRYTKFLSSKEQTNSRGGGSFFKRLFGKN